MKRGLVLALAVAAITAIIGAPAANAHFLSGSKAYNTASSFARRVAINLAEISGSDVKYGVKKPCSQRSPHRWVCDSRYQFTDQNGNPADCTMKIISQFASSTSYTVKAKGTGINCD